MNVKIVCFCIGLCVVVSSAVPVAQLTSVEGGDVEKPVDRVLVVKRSAQFHRGSAGLPCPGFSAYRCPHPNLPALCRGFDFSPCHDTEFISVNI